jgi:hypothetical protein
MVGNGGSQMAMAAAAAGVGMITSMAKTFWGSYVLPTSSLSPLGSKPPSSSSSSGVAKGSKSSKRIPRFTRHPSDNDYLANRPMGKARQLERYLNYLLEHPALSTSFALNTILKVRLIRKPRYHNCFFSLPYICLFDSKETNFRCLLLLLSVSSQANLALMQQNIFSKSTPKFSDKVERTSRIWRMANFLFYFGLLPCLLTRKAHQRINT